MSLGFDSNDLIVALLIVQFVGFPAAICMANWEKSWGVRKAIYLAIVIYMGDHHLGDHDDRQEEFYVLAIVIGLVQGGIQALSRSYYSRLIPADKRPSTMDSYNMLGKFAAIIGPALMGITGLVARRLMMPDNPTAEQIIEIGRQASRYSIASILILFILGGVLLYFVDEDKGRREAAYLSEK